MRILNVAVVLVSVLTAESVLAKDRVWLAPSRPTATEGTWYPRPIEPLSGNVLQLDQRQLRIQVEGANVDTQVASHRVVWIESDDLPAVAQQAMTLHAEGKFAESIRPFLDSLSSRPPVWRQQWLSMMAADAAYRGKKPTVALELVSQLDARPLPPIVISWLPVDWDGSVIDRTNETVAIEKLNDPSAAVRLVAASWLVRSRSRREAIAVLQQLALDNQRPVIARLAEVVSWRTALPPQVAPSAESWQRKVDALPMVLQTGPLKCLARIYQFAGLADEAKRLELSLELTPIVPKRGLSR